MPNEIRTPMFVYDVYVLKLHIFSSYATITIVGEKKKHSFITRGSKWWVNMARHQSASIVIIIKSSPSLMESPFFCFVSSVANCHIYKCHHLSMKIWHTVHRSTLVPISRTSEYTMWNNFINTLASSESRWNLSSLSSTSHHRQLCNYHRYAPIASQKVKKFNEINGQKHSNTSQYSQHTKILHSRHAKYQSR